MLFAFTKLKQHRFYVVATRRKISFSHYQQRKFPFAFRWIKTDHIAKSDLDYELSRWAHAGCSLPEAYNNALADRFNIGRDELTVILTLKY